MHLDKNKYFISYMMLGVHLNQNESLQDSVPSCLILFSPIRRLSEVHEWTLKADTVASLK